MLLSTIVTGSDQCFSSATGGSTGGSVSAGPLSSHSLSSTGGGAPSLGLSTSSGGGGGGGTSSGFSTSGGGGGGGEGGSGVLPYLPLNELGRQRSTN